jgi:hypothetical protein
MWVPFRRALAALTLLLLFPAVASAGPLDDPADQWLPRSDGASWTYAWSNTAYQPAARKERYVMTARSGTSFRLSWTEIDPPATAVASAGTIDFQHTDTGLVNTNYQSTQPPPSFPILCASASDCASSLSAAWYLVIWGTRSPVFAEPMLQGTRWNSLGGASNDVASTNRYIGHSKVKVPAFPAGVDAARIDSEVTQAGAIGDPFGTLTRTTYWVRGVGPVRTVLRHASGETSTAELLETNLMPRPLPSDVNLLPLNTGDSGTLRWRNSKHMKRWSTQKYSVSDVVNSTARVDVKHVSGPIRVSAAYAFATRLSGVTLLSGSTRSSTKDKLPKLGRARHFVTPLDLRVFGFNPIVPPLGSAKGTTWRSSRTSRDYGIFGVTGVATDLGEQTVRVPAGKFTATVIRTTLSQSGSSFGSGTRTSYFAAGKGLVKLVFRHKDGSVSTVERVR